MKSLSALGLLSLLFLLGSATAPGAATPSYVYHWPVAPFDRQHPIRGAFGDPRTIARDQPFGVTGPTRSGAYSFHSGIDIVAKPGTPVYPVVSGEVLKARPHKIVVQSSNARVFSYWHLRSNVHVGQTVVAEQTVLGWIHKPLDHVHLAEIDNGRYQNPLARGHLAPYRDHTIPRVVALDVSAGGSPRLTQGGLLKKGAKLAIRAVDAPAMPVPGPFAGLPQTPARVEWRLSNGPGWGGWNVAVDSRRTLPMPRSGFWEIYATGTYQNSPTFARRLFEGVAGRYLFRISLDPKLLPPGRYELEARASDIRGNSSTRTWHLRIASA